MARSSMEERKEEILEAGLEVFAKKGYYNTTTAHIAEKAGISQPYVFRFFKTKETLFIAALDRAFERILQTLKRVHADQNQLVAEMITAYEELSELYPNEIALQVIGISVTENAVRDAVQKGLTNIRSFTLDRFKAAGIKDAEKEVTTFLARGILCNISYFIDLPELMDKKEE